MATSTEFSFNGQPVIDPAHTYYVGGSLGGIMGNTFMAYDPNITRGVLAVPGGVWSMLFERSNAWHLLQGAAQGAYPDPETYQLNIAFLGMGFEPYDPITTAAHVIHDPLPGVPAKNILMWYSIGDCLVSNITTEMVARDDGDPAGRPRGEAGVEHDRVGRAAHERHQRVTTITRRRCRRTEHPARDGQRHALRHQPQAGGAARGQGVPARHPGRGADLLRRRRDHAGALRLRDRRL